MGENTIRMRKKKSNEYVPASTGIKIQRSSPTKVADTALVLTEVHKCLRGKGADAAAHERAQVIHPLAARHIFRLSQAAECQVKQEAGNENKKREREAHAVEERRGGKSQ